MYDGKEIGAVLLMGGEGRRFGGPVPKQFYTLGQKKIYLYAVEALLGASVFDEIVLVCHSGWVGVVRDEVGPSLKVIEGGSTRQESSYRGLLGFGKPREIVLIHDAVRPFVTERMIKENIEKAILHGAADTCIPSVDTLVYAPLCGLGDRRIANIPKREEYLRGQTPQTFRMDWILAAHERALEAGVQNATDDCQLVLQTGRSVAVVMGEERNLKITSDFDLLLAEYSLVQKIEST